MRKKMSRSNYLVSCEVFKDEIDKLSLNRDYKIIFLGMTLHSNYNLLEKNLRKVLNNIKKENPNQILLVYGDYCLGLNREMKKLAHEFGSTKIDAINCIDCFLGGKGNYLKLDPEQKLIFLTPGWIKYFYHQKQTTKKEERVFLKKMFNGFKGIILLETIENFKKYSKQIQDFVDFTGLKILEKKKVNTNKIKQLITKVEKAKS